MYAESIDVNLTEVQATSNEMMQSGTFGMIVGLILVVGAIGYLNNLIRLDNPGDLAHWVRAIGACCPPLGAVLGFM